MTWNSHTRWDRPKPRADWGFRAVVIGIILIIAAGVIVTTVLYNSTRTTATCTIESKDRSVKVKDGNSSTSYRVYTQDCGIFEVADNPFLFKFNSADTYESIKEGETYKLETIGWRNGFFSAFPNILSATPAA